VVALARIARVIALSAALLPPAPAPAQPDSAIRAAFARPQATPFPADNPYSEAKERLGRMLFFEPRLSDSGTIACASCHVPALGWSDAMPTAIGHEGTPLRRRTPSIQNAAWLEALMWDGRADTLEEQALMPIADRREMNRDPQEAARALAAVPAYRHLFEQAFPGEAIDASTIARALATYQRTITSGETAFDRWLAGDARALSPEAVQGFALFTGRARCALCHEGWRLTDDSFHDIGRPGDDPGRAEVLPGILLMQHAFKTPGLRNVARRAPYMHDGSLPDLAAVVEHYRRGGIARPSRSPEIVPVELTQHEAAELISFLLHLSSDDPVPEPPELPE
jgi:cytochrome c peroxidase